MAVLQQVSMPATRCRAGFRSRHGATAVAAQRRHLRRWSKIVGAVVTAIVASAALPPWAASAAAATSWVKVVGGAGRDYTRDVALDGAGNAYVVGGFEQVLTLGPGAADTLVAHGKTDVYLAKYDASGAFQWARQIGSTLDDRAGGVAVLPSGRVVAVGTGWGNTVVGTLGSGGVTLPSHGATDAFLATFSPTGDLVWASSQGGPGYEDAAAITSDAWGRVAITGSFTQAAAFGSSVVLPGGTTQPGTNPVMLTAKALQDAYAASFDASGQLRWSVDAAAGGNQDLGQAILAIGGRVVVAGTFSGSAKIGTTTVYASGLNEGAGYLASLSNADGGVAWIRLLRGAPARTAAPLDLAAAPNGDLVAVGGVRGAVDFVEPGKAKQATLNAGGSTSTASSFALRFGQGGAYRWAAIGASTTSGTATEAVGVAVSATGDVFVVGRFSGQTTWSNTPERGAKSASATSSGGPDGFIARYSPWGTVAGLDTVSGDGDESIGAIAIGGGDARIVGSFLTNATFPGSTTRTSTTIDGFVSSLTP